MNRQLVFTTEAAAALKRLQSDPAKTGLCRQLQKVLGFLETNLRHPSLNTHEYASIQGPNGEKVFEAYVQNNTPGAHRVFFHYGPDDNKKQKRQAILTIIAIIPHP